MAVVYASVYLLTLKRASYASSLSIDEKMKKSSLIQREFVSDYPVAGFLKRTECLLLEKIEAGDFRFPPRVKPR